MGHCSTYEVRYPIPDRVNIVIKMLTGKLIDLYDVRSEDTIYNVKEMIQEKEGYAIPTQYFIYSGKILENDRTLRDYYIQMDSVIHLVLRLRRAVRNYRYNPSPWTTKPRRKGKRALRKNNKVNEKGNIRQQENKKGNIHQQVNKKGNIRQQVNKKGKTPQQVNKKGKSRCQRRERTSDLSVAGTSKQP